MHIIPPDTIDNMVLGDAKLAERIVSSVIRDSYIPVDRLDDVEWSRHPVVPSQLDPPPIILMGDVEQLHLLLRTTEYQPRHH